MTRKQPAIDTTLQHQDPGENPCATKYQCEYQMQLYPEQTTIMDENYDLTNAHK